MAGSIPLTVVVGPNPGTSGVSVSAGTNYPGDWSIVQLVTRDANGVPLGTGGTPVTFSQIGGTSQVEVLPAQDLGNGRYQAVFVIQSTGTPAVLQARRESKPLTGHLRYRAQRRLMHQVVQHHSREVLGVECHLSYSFIVYIRFGLVVIQNISI